MEHSIKLINTKGKSNKFWNAEVISTESPKRHIVKVSYGRIGAKGTTKEFKFSWQYEAVNYYQSKVSEKTRKGYKEVKEDREVEIRAKIADAIGTSDKVGSVFFTEKLGRGSFSTINESQMMDPNIDVAVYLKVRSRKGDGIWIHYMVMEDTVFYKRTNGEITHRDDFIELEDKELQDKLEKIYSLVLDNFSIFKGV